MITIHYYITHDTYTSSIQSQHTYNSYHITFDKDFIVKEEEKTGRNSEKKKGLQDVKEIDTEKREENRGKIRIN